MSFTICRRSRGDTSRPAWNGTVVHRPSGWRYCLWEPLWRTSTNPSLTRMDATSRGLRTGGMLSDGDPLGPDELRFELWLAIFQEHFDDLPEIGVQLVESRPLGVGTWKAWNIAHVKARFGTALDDRHIGPHRLHHSA